MSRRQKMNKETAKELISSKKENAGTLRADGTFIVDRKELPNGWQETHKVGKLRIRGEREPRSINYNDYAKLLTFWSTQERLIKDRKHVMVVMSDGSAINTADITSLDLQEEQKWIPKTANVSEDIRKLPTTEILLSLDGKILALTVQRKNTKQLKEEFLVARCHFREKKNGSREYLTKLDQIPEALQYRNAKDEDYPPIVVQRFTYGIPQLTR